MNKPAYFVVCSSSQKMIIIGPTYRPWEIKLARSYWVAELT